MSMLTSLVGSEVRELTSAFRSDDKEEDPDAKEKSKKEEEKREQAIQQQQEERRKKFEKEQYQREKMRQNLRDKYGIQKKESGPSKSAVESVKKDYNMGAEEARKFDQAIAQDQSRRSQANEKIEKKLERREKKKAMKRQMTDSCKTQ